MSAVRPLWLRQTRGSVPRTYARPQLPLPGHLCHLRLPSSGRAGGIWQCGESLPTERPRLQRRSNLFSVCALGWAAPSVRDHGAVVRRMLAIIDQSRAGAAIFDCSVCVRAREAGKCQATLLGFGRGVVANGALWPRSSLSFALLAASSSAGRAATLSSRTPPTAADGRGRPGRAARRPVGRVVGLGAAHRRTGSADPRRTDEAGTEALWPAGGGQASFQPKEEERGERVCALSFGDKMEERARPVLWDRGGWIRARLLCDR